MKGIITDIQRFSLNDGPGIRTTVFFKGCNMHCSWCHNPETINFKREISFYPQKCIGCGKCFTVCPNGSHKLDKNGVHFIERSLCTGCGKCADVCFADALVMCGIEKNVDDIMAEIVQDKEYYDYSGGGVTLSGGEVLAQSDFARSLVKACKEKGIHTAVESNISFPFQEVEGLLREVDLIMCDFKIFDNDLHRKYTGISNDLIKENLLKLDSLGVPIIVRTPLIPGVTNTTENINLISKYISPLKNLVRYELLNFNPLGAYKYDGIDKENEFRDVQPLSSEKMENLITVAKNNVSNVRGV